MMKWYRSQPVKWLLCREYTGFSLLFNNCSFKRTLARIFLQGLYCGVESLGAWFTQNMNQFTSESWYRGTMKNRLWGEAQRGNMGKQACYFQAATLDV